jgi:hypothetical protein
VPAKRRLSAVGTRAIGAASHFHLQDAQTDSNLKEVSTIIGVYLPDHRRASLKGPLAEEVRKIV